MREMKDSRIKWIGKIPKKWTISKMKYVSSIESGVSISKNEYRSDGKYEIIGANGILGYIDRINNKQKAITTGRVGTIGTAYKIEKAWVTDNALIITANSKINYGYLYWILPNLDFIQITSGTAMPLLTTSSLSKQVLPIPKLQEQKRIANFLDNKCAEIDILYADIESQLETLEEYKKSIITEAVTKGLDSDVEMKDSGISYIGNIPKHWKVTNLKYLGKCQNGISKGGEYFGNGFPFVSYGDVYKNYSLPQNVDGLIMSTKTEQNIYSVKYGDVFFTRTSETIEEIGFASTCLKSIENSVFAGFLIRFRPVSNDLIPEFSKFYFRSNIHRKFFVKEMNLVTRASLSQNLLGRLQVLLPPLFEQQMIAKNLEKKCTEIDSAIEDKKMQMQILEQYKKSLIYEYVTGKKEVE